MDLQTNMELENLLNRYLKKKCTQEEKQQLYQLLSSSDNERSFKEIIFSHLREFNEDPQEKVVVDFDNIYNQILTGIKQKETKETKKTVAYGRIKVSWSLIKVITIAAVFCIAFFLGSLFSSSHKSKLPEQATIVTYSEIKAPYGSKSEINLPDGSRVTLNAGSSLKYPSNFNSDNRDLILVGEAYFKVARNLEIPLIVKAGNINIKAVGTAFNVKAYDDDGLIETTLIEGKVEITHFRQGKEGNQYLNLNPKQKAIYIKESDSFTLEKIKAIDSSVIKPVKTIYNDILISPGVDVTQVIAWTQGKLIIRGESLDNLCVELQRKYNVKFIFMNEEIKKYRFSGVLLDETLEQVLNVIKLTAPINYHFEGKTVFLSTNKEQLSNYSKHLK